MNEYEEYFRSDDWADLRYARENATPQDIARHLLDPQWADRDYDALDELVAMTRQADMTVLSEDDLADLAASELPELRQAAIRFEGTPFRILADMALTETNSRLLEMLVDTGRLDQRAIDMCCWRQPDARMLARMLSRASDRCVTMLAERDDRTARIAAVNSGRLDTQRLGDMLGRENDPGVLGALIATRRLGLDQETEAIGRAIRAVAASQTGPDSAEMIRKAAETMLAEADPALIGMLMCMDDDDAESWRILIGTAVELHGKELNANQLSFISYVENNAYARGLLTEHGLLKPPATSRTATHAPAREPRTETKPEEAKPEKETEAKAGVNPDAAPAPGPGGSDEFNLQLLGRLRDDIAYYLGPSHSEKYLWAGGIEEQIAKLRELDGRILGEDRPEWFTPDWIDHVARDMRIQKTLDALTHGGSPYRSRLRLDAWIADHDRIATRYPAGQIDGYRVVARDGHGHASRYAIDWLYDDNFLDEEWSENDMGYGDTIEIDADDLERLILDRSMQIKAGHTGMRAHLDAITDGHAAVFENAVMSWIWNHDPEAQANGADIEQVTGYETLTPTAQGEPRYRIDWLDGDGTPHEGPIMTERQLEELHDGPGTHTAPDTERNRKPAEEHTPGTTEDTGRTPLDAAAATDRGKDEPPSEEPVSPEPADEGRGAEKTDGPRIVFTSLNPGTDGMPSGEVGLLDDDAPEKIKGILAAGNGTAPSTSPDGTAERQARNGMADIESGEATGARPDPSDRERENRRENINRLLDVLPVTMVTKDGSHQVTADEIMAASDGTKAAAPTADEPETNAEQAADTTPTPEPFDWNGVEGLADGIGEWYGHEFPDDQEGGRIDPRVTFREAVESFPMGDGHDFYAVVGAVDSTVRERVFEELSKRLDCEYSDIYDAWMHRTNLDPGLMGVKTARMREDVIDLLGDDAEAYGTIDAIADRMAGDTRLRSIVREADRDIATHSPAFEEGLLSALDGRPEAGRLARDDRFAGLVYDMVRDERRFDQNGHAVAVRTETLWTVDEFQSMMGLVNRVAERLADNENVRAIMGETTSAEEAADAGLGQMIDDMTDVVAHEDPDMAETAENEYITSGRFARNVYSQIAAIIQDEQEETEDDAPTAEEPEETSPEHDTPNRTEPAATTAAEPEADTEEAEAETPAEPSTDAPDGTKSAREAIETLKGIWGDETYIANKARVVNALSDSVAEDSLASSQIGNHSNSKESVLADGRIRSIITSALASMTDGEFGDIAAQASDATRIEPLAGQVYDLVRDHRRIDVDGINAYLKEVVEKVGLFGRKVGVFMTSRLYERGATPIGMADIADSYDRHIRDGMKRGEALKAAAREHGHPLDANPVEDSTTTTAPAEPVTEKPEPTKPEPAQDTGETTHSGETAPQTDTEEGNAPVGEATPQEPRQPSHDSGEEPPEAENEDEAEQLAFDFTASDDVDSPEREDDNKNQHQSDDAGAVHRTGNDASERSHDDGRHALPVQGDQENEVPVHGGEPAGTAQGAQKPGDAGHGQVHGPGAEGVREDDHRVRQPLGSDAPAPEAAGRLGSMAQGAQNGGASGRGDRDQGRDRSALTRIDRDLLDPDLQTAGTSLERAKGNVHAIEVLRDLEETGREPAAEDIRALSAYAGWGGAQDAFDEDTRNPAWREINTRLRELLSDDEYADARASTLTAFYTPRPVVDAIWETLDRAGFGRDPKHPDMVLEPGCGTGNFIRRTPKGSSYGFTGIEVDPISAGIARYLCPEDDIINNRMEHTGLPDDAFDLAVGNVPYSDTIKIRGASIHDWFIGHSLDTVRPGGLVAVLTSRYTLDKNTSKIREGLARRAELVAACRLPRETFDRQAGTEVVSDILILRKRDKPEPEAAADWLDTVDFRQGVKANRLFVEHPEYVAGTMTISPGPFGPRIDVIGDGDMDELGITVGNILTEQLEAYGIDLHDRLGARANEPIVIPDETTQNAMRYTVDDNGHVWYGNMYGQPVIVHSPVRKGGDERLASMIRLRDQAERLLAIERDPNTADDAVEQGIRDLDAAYERFVASYGRLNSKDNLRVFDPALSDASLNQLYALEKTGANGFEGKSDMLSKRVVTPTPPMPEHTDEPVEALSISLDRKGGVDLGLIGKLLGTQDDIETAERLGDLIVTDPDTGKPVPAEAYLSGNVGGKIDHVEALIRDMTEKPERERVQAWLKENGLSDDVVGEPTKAMDGRRELTESGAWSSATDPLHTDVAVMDSEWFEYAIKTYGGRMASMSIAGMFLDDCKPGVSLLPEDWDAADPQGNKLFDSFFQNAFVVDDGANSVARVLYKAVTADPDAIDDRVVATILARGEYEYINMRNALRKITDPGLWKESYDASSSDYLALARELRGHPEICEYLYAADLDRLNRPTNSPKLAKMVSVEGLEQWRSRRNEWMESHPIEPVDMDCLQALRNLRGRLEQTMPTRLTHEEITAKLGSTWIPAGVIRDFMVETFEIDGHGKLTNSVMRSLAVSHDKMSGNWQVNASMGSKLDEEIIREYGLGTGSGRNPFEIVSGALNSTTSNLTKPDPDDPTGKRKIRDEQATALMYQKRHDIERKFGEWVWKDPARTRMLEDAYNHQFNRIHPREYDGSYLTFPGLNADISLYQHQRNAIARILQSEEGTLVAHVVGAGKTYTGIVACHEAKRLGKASKPMIVVPNHLTEQWAKDYLTLYPDANVLSMNEADGSGKGAARFWAKVAAGDWDAVIVRQDTFQRMHISPERRQEYYGRRIEEMLESIGKAYKNGNDFAVRKLRAEVRKMRGNLEKTVKQAEKDRTRVDSKLQTLRGGTANKGWLDFEDLGVDMLFVDEAHQFKNLAIATMINVPGVDVAAAAKCEDLLDKCELLRDQGKGSNIVFATGTPVSNSMSELYNMQRYLAPNLLKAQGVFAFTDWANTFGSVIESVEVKPEGGGYQIKQRFSRFHNLPELMNSFHTYADLLTADQLDLDVPDCEVVPVPVEATPQQKRAVEELVERGERVRDGIDPSVDNMLNITNDGRKVSLDPKLLNASNPDIKPMEGGKVQVCAEKIHEIWKEHAGEKATQLVFCDTSTPASGKWNIQSDLKRRLVDLGIPDNEIMFAGREKNPQKKQALFDQVRKGEVRVLIGSTGTLGTGTNVQDRLLAVHDLDCPWKPAELEQRQGRVRRQGNMYDKVYDYRYVTVGTFDSYMFQTVERKARFISQVMSSGSPAREAADVDETVLKLADMKAIATGDPHIVERMEAENRLGQLKLLRRAHATQQKEIQSKISTQLQPVVNGLEREYANMVDDQTVFQRADDLRRRNRETGMLGITLDNESFTDRELALERIRTLADRRTASSETGGTGMTAIGEYCGLTVIAKRVDYFGNYLYVGLQGQHNHWANNTIPSLGASDDALRQLGRLITSCLNPEKTLGTKIANAKADLKSAQNALAKPWEGQQEYDELTDRIARMDLEIKHGQAEDGIGEDTDIPQPEEAPDARREQPGTGEPRIGMGQDIDTADETAASTDLPMPDPGAIPGATGPAGPGIGM